MRIAGVVTAATAFAVAYTQAPLYTSNQNQYFLHGLARAGFGFLKFDWLARTADPTPLFSFLVQATYLLNQWEGLFYIYYAILMGIYLFSLIKIVGIVFPVLINPGPRFTLLTGLILVHSAGIRFFFARLAGANWTYILEDGVADQRLLGSVFQPSTFGVLLLLSIYLFLSRRVFWAVVSAVVAASVHPTYLLSSGILVLTYMLLLFKESRSIREPTTVGLFALILILPILAYVFLNFGSISPEITESARQVLVGFRIPHHAEISWWFDATAVVKILLVIFALWLVKKSELFLILGLPFITAVFLTGIQAFTGNPALALLFPWRVSTWLVPVSTTIILGWMIMQLFREMNEHQPRAFPVLYAINGVIIFLAVSTGMVRTYLEFTRMDNAPEKAMFEWVSEHKSASDQYLVPLKMQDFRLVTGAPIYIDFKSIPYRDADVLEWYRRVGMADRFYDSRDCDMLSELAEQRTITHVVVPSGDLVNSCPQASQVFRDSEYSIFSVIPSLD